MSKLNSIIDIYTIMTLITDPEIRNKTYYKYIKSDMYSKNGLYKYQIGFNELNKPFDIKGDCMPDGLYISDEDNLKHFTDYGSTLCIIKIPEDAQMVLNPNDINYNLIKKYRVDKLEIIETYDLSKDRSKYYEKFPFLKDLSGADLEGVDLTGANLTGVNLSGADLRGAILIDADLSYANLEGVYLEGVNLRGAYLTNAYLTGANLLCADLSGTNLSGTNLSGSNLTDADLTGSNLSGVNLRGANLSGVNLRGANLKGVNLTNPPILKDIIYKFKNVVDFMINKFKDR